MSAPAAGLAYDELFEAASFRDPAGRVLERHGRVFRLLSRSGADEFRWLQQQGLLDALVRTGMLIPTAEVNPSLVGFDRTRAPVVLEHERVPFVSYPYEWTFSALKAAALLHLDLQLWLLARGATLIDASAYNVQFRGPRPVFIDVLSLRQYRDGQLWDGYCQFGEQFLHPLLLQAYGGVAFNAWYRGAMAGLPVEEFAALLPRRRLSWRVLLHVVAPARLQRAARAGTVRVSPSARQRRLPLRALVQLLRGLRAWIQGLEPSAPREGGWSRYTSTHTYTDREMAAKEDFVAAFVAACRPRRLLDLGCNSGHFAAVALRAGAGAVIGLEADAAAADDAFRRADRDRLAFLPLVMDAADPSPAQGWRGQERRSFAQRASFDALLALAFTHHLAIGRNIPLDALAAWILGLAPRGVIEFVPKTDPTVQRMLALRDDIFPAYSVDAWRAAVARCARVVRQDAISSTGRTLFWYDRELR